MDVGDGWDDVNAVTPAAARDAGQAHADYWMRALWLLYRFKPNGNVRRWATVPNPQRFPDLVRCKATVYLSYVTDPPDCDADVFHWRITPDVQVGPALCWWMEMRTGLETVVPTTLVSSAGESLLRRYGTMSASHAHLLSIAEGFATRSDLSVTSMDIKGVMMENMRLRGASPSLAAAALASPELFSDLFIPPTVPGLHDQHLRLERH
jgi:hypothetical protein